MIELAMHISDIVENSVNAGAKNVIIQIEEKTNEDQLIIAIHDDGRGMDEVMVKRALDPFVTTKEGKKVGLGLSLLAEAARKTGGKMGISSKPHQGTHVEAVFVFSHVDRQPLGNMTDTLWTLIIGNPDVEFSYTVIQDNHLMEWNTGEIKKQFGNMNRSSPDVFHFIRQELEKVEAVRSTPKIKE